MQRLGSRLAAASNVGEVAQRPQRVWNFVVKNNFDPTVSAGDAVAAGSIFYGCVPVEPLEGLPDLGMGVASLSGRRVFTRR